MNMVKQIQLNTDMTDPGTMKHEHGEANTAEHRHDGPRHNET